MTTVTQISVADALADPTFAEPVTVSKRDTALFYIQELKNDGAKRKDIVETLMGVLNISSANAAYYVDRVAKAALIKR
jgi:hypothetical protein